MDRFQAMTVFSSVVEAGSFARAAGRLGMSVSAVSRHVADLEAHLQTRLLNRTTRRLSLTETGQAFHERCVQLLADMDEAERAASHAATVARGTIKLTCSINFGVRHLAPAIGAFLARHPEVKFEASLSDRIVDLVEEGYDLGIRIGTLGSTNLVARRLGATCSMVVASPAYLAKHGTPATPEELSRHNCFTYAYTTAADQWKFRDRSGRERIARVGGNIHANNGDLLAAAAVQGVGITFEPNFIVGPDVRAGRLVQLLTDFEAPQSEIWAVYPSRRHLPAKVRVFVEFLIERFRDAGDWSEPAGEGAPAPSGATSAAPPATRTTARMAQSASIRTAARVAPSSARTRAPSSRARLR